VSHTFDPQDLIRAHIRLAPGVRGYSLCAIITVSNRVRGEDNTLPRTIATGRATANMVAHVMLS
jgi:hypothetical protein